MGKGKLLSCLHINTVHTHVHTHTHTALPCPWVTSAYTSNLAARKSSALQHITTGQQEEERSSNWHQLLKKHHHMLPLTQWRKQAETARWAISHTLVRRPTKVSLPWISWLQYRETECSLVLVTLMLNWGTDPWNTYVRMLGRMSNNQSECTKDLMGDQIVNTRWLIKTILRTNKIEVHWLTHNVKLTVVTTTRISTHTHPSPPPLHTH